jgi:uncharacterized protein YrrD
MVQYGDMHFRKGAVVEFLVAEKESVTNIHKWLKMHIVSMLLTKALLIVGLHELQVLRKPMHSTVMHIALAGQQQNRSGNG